MTQSALVKIGLPAEEAEGEKRIRQIRQILQQRDAARARITAAAEERIREVLKLRDEAEQTEQQEQTA